MVFAADSVSLCRGQRYFKLPTCLPLYVKQLQRVSGSTLAPGNLIGMSSRPVTNRDQISGYFPVRLRPILLTPQQRSAVRHPEETGQRLGSPEPAFCQPACPTFLARNNTPFHLRVRLTGVRAMFPFERLLPGVAGADLKHGNDPFITTLECDLPTITTPLPCFPVATLDFLKVHPVRFAREDCFAAIVSETPHAFHREVYHPELF